MSSNNSTTPETPKPSKFVQKLNSMKPAAMSDEKKATVLGRIKTTAAFAAGVLTTVAVVAAASYYNSVNNNEDAEVEETEETTED
jgi:hypothetical protein